MPLQITSHRFAYEFAPWFVYEGINCSNCPRSPVFNAFNENPTRLHCRVTQSTRVAKIPACARVWYIILHFTIVRTQTLRPRQLWLPYAVGALIVTMTDIYRTKFPRAANYPAGSGLTFSGSDCRQRNQENHVFHA